MGQRISQLDLAGPLTGAELFPMVQDGKTKKVSAASFTPLFTGGCQCTLVSRNTTVGTDANTLEKFLHTWQMPANTLRSNGDWIEIIAWGTMSNSNNKTLNINFGGTALTTGAGVVNNASWDMVAIVSRVSQTSQKMKMGVITQSNASSWSSTVSVERNGTASENLGTEVSISLSGQNSAANANDITVEGFIIRLNQIDVNS